jgi:hypothetical protein
MTLLSRLSRAAVALAAAAFAFVGTAHAQDWRPNDDDALLLELRSGKYRLGDTLRGYQTRGGVCVDFADVIRALDLPVRLDRKSRRATGWIFSEAEYFLLDRDSFKVQNANAVMRLAPGDLHDTPEGWFVATGALSQWFGVTFRPDMPNLKLVIESARPLPFLQAIERKSRAARLRPAESSFDLAALHRAELPYKAWRTPSVDVLVRAAWRGGGNRDSARELQYEAYASGEALGASFDARFASDAHAMPASLRFKAYRVDAEAQLLGPLHATQVAAGDIETFAGALTGQSAVGRGVFISNRPVTRPARFGMTTLRGVMPAGWDAELYRNGQLVAYQGGREDGRYQFDDVSLLFGDNLLEVVLYGPQGQIRRERSNVPIGTDSIPASQTWYWAGIVDQGRDLVDFRTDFSDPLTGWRWGVGVERGLDKRTTIGAETQSLVMEGRRHNYIEGTIRRAVSPMLLELSAAQELGSGRAVRAQAIGRVGRIHVQAETLWVDGGYTSELVSPDDRRLYGLRLDTQLKAGNWRLPVGVGARRRQSRDGATVTEWVDGNPSSLRVSEPKHRKRRPILSVRYKPSENRMAPDLEPGT